MVELVVVIAILGILAAIAVPRLLGFQKRAEEQADHQTAVQVRNSVALLHANKEIIWTTAPTAGAEASTVGYVKLSNPSTIGINGFSLPTGVAITDLTGAISIKSTTTSKYIRINGAGEVKVLDPNEVTTVIAGLTYN